MGLACDLMGGFPKTIKLDKYKASLGNIHWVSVYYHI